MTASPTKVIRGTMNSALVPKYWVKKYLEDQHEKDPLKPWYGVGNIVTTAYDLKAEKGDTIEVPIVGLPTGDGVTDDGDYDGDITGIAVYNLPITIHEHGKSFGLNGLMTEKSAAFAARTMTMDACTKWRSMFNTRAVIDALSGLALHSLGGNVLGASGLTSISCVTKVAPAYLLGSTAKRYYCGGETVAGVYTGRVTAISGIAYASLANYLMGPNVIEDVHRMAKASVDSSGNLLDPIQPVNVNGKMMFIMLVTLKQAKALRNNAVWRNGHYYADVRGMENSIYSGQLGVWDNVMVIETDLLHMRTMGAIRDTHAGPGWFDASGDSGVLQSGVSVHRALFLGANAVAWAWGKAPEYKEFYADHAQTKWAMRVTSIYGVMKVCKYSSTTSTASVVSDSERGCIVVDTAVS